MIPKEAIERAIEGGWTCDTLLNNVGLGEPKWAIDEENALFVIARVECPLGAAERYHYRTSLYKVALDPSFWQSLAKTLKWERWCCTGCKTLFDASGIIQCTGCRKIGARYLWECRAVHFYHLILNGEPTEAYWNELLNV